MTISRYIGTCAHNTHVSMYTYSHAHTHTDDPIHSAVEELGAIFAQKWIPMLIFLACLSM